MGKQQKTTDISVKKVHEQPNEQFIVGSFFNGLEIPSDSSFDLYKHKGSDTLFLHGENSTLEYNGYTNGDAAENEYVVAVYDAKEKSVELFKAPVVAGTVSAIKNRVHKGPKIKSRGGTFMAQRIALGKEFGTKKAKNAIDNAESNRIVAENLKHMEMDIVDNVKENTSSLPTFESLRDESATTRPTPPANEAATSPQEIYSISELIGQENLQYIRVAALMDESDPEKRISMLPFTESAYINKLVQKQVAMGDQKKVSWLYYVSLMMGMYKLNRCRNKDDLMDNLGKRPVEKLVDSIIEQFAVNRVGSRGKSKGISYTVDPFHQDKLLCYMLAVLFHIENFMLEIVPLASALNLKPTRLQGLLRALGAVIKPVGAAEAEALGLSKREAAGYKVAQLKVPFSLPTMMKSGKRR